MNPEAEEAWTAFVTQFCSAFSPWPWWPWTAATCSSSKLVRRLVRTSGSGVKSESKIRRWVVRGPRWDMAFWRAPPLKPSLEEGLMILTLSCRVQSCRVESVSGLLESSATTTSYLSYWKDVQASRNRSRIWAGSL